MTFINFRFINGDDFQYYFSSNFTFNDLNWDDDNVVSLFYISDCVCIDKNNLLYDYIDNTIYVIYKERNTLLPWINKIMEYYIEKNYNVKCNVFSALSSNINAISILEKHINNIHWSNLSKNINAISILDKHIDKIDWFWLSKNENAIHILEQNIDKINWHELSSNINAIHILEKHIDKIYPRNLSINIDKNNWFKKKHNGGLFLNTHMFLNPYLFE